MFRLIFAICLPWLFASLAFYILGASITSFAELRNNFNFLNWSEAGRAMYFILSIASLVVSIVSYYMEVERKNV